MPVHARIGSFTVGDGARPLLIAGSCVIESEAMTLSIAEKIAALPETRDFQFVFMASFVKAKRRAGECFRGAGLVEGLRVLE